MAHSARDRTLAKGYGSGLHEAVKIPARRSSSVPDRSEFASAGARTCLPSLRQPVRQNAFIQCRHGYITTLLIQRAQVFSPAVRAVRAINRIARSQLVVGLMNRQPPVSGDPENRVNSGRDDSFL
jgi:hypothetical protein